MRLNEEEYYDFIDLHKRLLFFMGKVHKLLPEDADYEVFQRTPQREKFEIRNLLYEHPWVIDDFLEQYADELSEQERTDIAGFKQFREGSFTVMKQLKKYAVFMDEDYLFGVLALNDPFETFWGNNLPRYVKTVLIPFRDKIVYDGFITPYPVNFGSGMRASFNHEYKLKKAKHGILTTLPVPADTEEAETDYEELLVSFMKTKTSREYNEYEIEDLLEKHPHLMPVYRREWGRINSRAKRKTLRSLNLKEKKYYALYVDTIIAIGKDLPEAKKIVESLLKEEADRAGVYYFKV